MHRSLPGSSVRGHSPGHSTGVGRHSLLQEIFPTQRLNPGPLHCKLILYHLSHQDRGLLEKVFSFPQLAVFYWPPGFKTCLPNGSYFLHARFKIPQDWADSSVNHWFVLITNQKQIVIMKYTNHVTSQGTRDGPDRSHPGAHGSHREWITFSISYVYKLMKLEEKRSMQFIDEKHKIRRDPSDLSKTP